MTDKMTFRVERTEYAEIEVDVPALLVEWSDNEMEGTPFDREVVIEVLYKIGVQDLMYSGDFITVTEKGADEEIH